jgi:purine-binding chemotaxis protein CheW
MPLAPEELPENLSSLWDRLRERLEQMRVSLEQKGGPEAREKTRAGRAQLLRRQAVTVEKTELPLHYLAFGKGRKRYGIPLDFVLEVQALEHVSPVPQAPPAFLGVVPWRGAILALLDLSRLFEVAEAGLSDLHAYVVVDAAGKRLAVAASQVEEIVAVPAHRLQTVPALPAKIAPEWVIGVHDENRLILKMDEIIKYLEQRDKGRG